MSRLDWFRDDYPEGNTEHGTGRPKGHGNWASYYKFMNKQLTELLTNYGPVGAIWFDGIWDQPTNFNWQLEEQYALIHKLQPSCLIGNTDIFGSGGFDGRNPFGSIEAKDRIRMPVWRIHYG